MWVNHGVLGVAVLVSLGVGFWAGEKSASDRSVSKIEYRLQLVPPDLPSIRWDQYGLHPECISINTHGQPLTLRGWNVENSVILVQHYSDFTIADSSFGYMLGGPVIKDMGGAKAERPMLDREKQKQ